MASVLFKHQLYKWGDNNGCSHFYDTSKYYSINFAWLGYESSGIPRSQFTELRLWLLDHVTQEVIIDLGEKGSIGSIMQLHFSKEEDLLFFKLSKWGNMELKT